MIIGIAGSPPRIQRAIEQLRAGKSPPQPSSYSQIGYRPWPGRSGEPPSYGQLDPYGSSYGEPSQPNYRPPPPEAAEANSHTQDPTHFGLHPDGRPLMNSLYYPPPGPKVPNPNAPN